MNSSEACRRVEEQRERLTAELAPRVNHFKIITLYCARMLSEGLEPDEAAQVHPWLEGRARRPDSPPGGEDFLHSRILSIAWEVLGEIHPIELSGHYVFVRHYYRKSLQGGDALLRFYHMEEEILPYLLKGARPELEAAHPDLQRLVNLIRDGEISP